MLPKAVTPLLIMLFFTSCNSHKTGKEQVLPEKDTKTELKGTLSINGAYALYPLISRMADDFMKINPGVKIEVARASTGEGITNLLAGKCQLAMISRPLTEEEANAGIWSVPVAKDGVAAIVNEKNPDITLIIDQGLSPDELMQIFISGKQLTWGEVLGSGSKGKITAFTRSDESGAAEIWASFLYKKVSDIKAIGVEGDPEMIASIQKNPLSIGFCNFTYAFDTNTGERTKDIQIVPVDLDFDNKIDRVEVPFRNLKEAHRSLWLGFFPDQLCRELTIGSIGKPQDPLIKGFIRYILSEGQQSVEKSGYCPLNNVYIKYALEELK